MDTAQLPRPRTRSVSIWRLNEMIDDGELIAEAPYQRGVVWSAEKMGDLVDSILNNYYIPPLLFAVRRGTDGTLKRVVIDGKQRLAACRRFTKNLVPYIDLSSGVPVKRFYREDEDGSIEANDNDQERSLRLGMDPPSKFLTQEEADKFDSTEFVAVEYTDITEEDEYNLFSRVQLGVSLTSADKLKATHSRLAEAGRRLVSEFKPLAKVLAKKSESELFKGIMMVYNSLAVSASEFRSRTDQLQRYIANESIIPDQQIIERLRRALSIMQTIAVNNPNVFRKYQERSVPFKTIEFVTFAKFITMVQRPRQIPDFIADFANIRKYFYAERTGSKFYISTSLWCEVVQWLENYIIREQLYATNNNVRSTAANRNYRNQLKGHHNNELPTTQRTRNRLPQQTNQLQASNPIPKSSRYMTTTPQVIEDIFKTEDELSSAESSDDIELESPVGTTVGFKRKSLGVNAAANPQNRSLDRHTVRGRRRPFAKRGGGGGRNNFRRESRTAYGDTSTSE